MASNRLGYELFDHTADVGVRLFAPSLPELARVAADGLYGVIGKVVPASDAVLANEPRLESFAFADSSDLAELLRDYLAELLLIFERDHRVVTNIEVEAFEPGRLVARGESRPVDRERSSLDREIKAVTYHGLAIRSVDGGYEATLVVDV